MDVEGLKIGAYRRLPSSWQQRAVRIGTPNFSVGAMVFLTDNGNRVLLVRPTYREGWLPPGGFLGRGEDAKTALRREMQEELALDIEAEPPHRVYLDVQRQGVTFVCVARLPVGAQPRIAGPELHEWRWFDLDEIPPTPEGFNERILEEDLEAVRRLT